MEIPKGYKVPPRTRFPENPLFQAMKQGANSIDLDASELFSPKRNENMEHYRTLLHKLNDDESKIDLAKNPNLLVSYWALYYPMRQYVIDHIKAPLQKAIEGAKTLKDMSEELFSAIKKIPLIFKKNVSFINTQILIDEREKLRKYHINPARFKLVDNAITLDIFEYEHDGYYAFIQDMVLIDLAMELAKGNWIPRFNKFPIARCWAGPDLPDIEEIRKNMKEALKDV